MDRRARLWKTARIAGLGCMLVVASAEGHPSIAQSSSASEASDSASQSVQAERPVNEAQVQAQNYPQQQPAAPIERRAPRGDYQAAYPQTPPPDYDQASAQSQASTQSGYDQTAPSDDPEADAYAADLTEEASIEAPPPLPVYKQPPCPDPDYLWTPGYWAWVPTGYYWVPGVWVAAPYYGALWTPGYWAFVGDRYRFHHGFWGPHIGFYGGINYGYGYTGYGYYGGYWRDRHFFYNTAVNRVNVNVVRNVYVRDVIVNNVVVNTRYDERVSYNGGRGGIMVRPRPEEIAVLHDHRIPPMQSQLAIRRQAEGNRGQFYRENQGRPQNAVFTRPVAADHRLPAVLPRVAGAAPNGSRGQDLRSGQPEGANLAEPGQNPYDPNSQLLSTAPVQPDLAPGGIYRQGGQQAPVNGRQAQPNTQPTQPSAQGTNSDRPPYQRSGQTAPVSNGQPGQSRPVYRDHPAQGISQPDTQPLPQPAYQARPAGSNLPSAQGPAQPTPQPTPQPYLRPDDQKMYPHSRPDYALRGSQSPEGPQSQYQNRGAAPQMAPLPAVRPESSSRSPYPQQRAQPQMEPHYQQPRPQPMYRPDPPPRGDVAHPEQVRSVRKD